MSKFFVWFQGWSYLRHLSDGQFSRVKWNCLTSVPITPETMAEGIL